MAFFLDTNIALRFTHTDSPDYDLVFEAVSALQEQGESICYTAQSIAEFWNVCTRPTTARGGFGLSIKETERRVLLLEKLFYILPDSLEVYETWRSLVLEYEVQGVQVHDARIAAAMKMNRIERILTFNGDDFKRYPFLRPVHPRDIPIKQQPTT